MTRRSSLLELAKKLRNSAGSSPTKNKPQEHVQTGRRASRQEQEQEQEVTTTTETLHRLDENGNIIGVAPSPPLKPTRRKSLTFNLQNERRPHQGRSSAAAAPERSLESSPRRRRRHERRRSAAACCPSSAPGAKLETLPDANSRKAGESFTTGRGAQVTSTTEGDSPAGRKSWAKTRRQLERMSTSELDSLLNADDEFVFDCLINEKPSIKKLVRERDHLRKQVSSLANFNYAREPEFVRDRLKLRELTDDVARMVKHAAGKHLEPILEKLADIQRRLADEAREREELSEALAHRFLSGDAACAEIDCLDKEHDHDKTYDEFIRQYIGLRKETSKKRILADRLARERDTLMSNILFKSLILANTSNSHCSSIGTDPPNSAASTTTKESTRSEGSDDAITSASDKSSWDREGALER